MIFCADCSAWEKKDWEKEKLKRLITKEMGFREEKNRERITNT